MCIRYISLFLVDGLHGLAFSLICCDDVVYAEGYSEWRYAKLNVGDSKEKVLASLGQPIHTFQMKDGSESYSYSKSASGWYPVRIVVLANNIVSFKHHYCEMD